MATISLSTYTSEYSSTLEVKSSSVSGAGAGNGVFSKTAFSSGDTIMTSLGSDAITLPPRVHQRCYVQEADIDYVTELYDRFGGTGRKAFLPTNEFRYLNHSFTPNVKLLNNKKLYAIADIEVGDELLLNYDDMGYYN